MQVASGRLRPRYGRTGVSRRTSCQRAVARAWTFCCLRSCRPTAGGCCGGATFQPHASHHVGQDGLTGSVAPHCGHRIARRTYRSGRNARL